MVSSKDIAATILNHLGDAVSQEEVLLLTIGLTKILDREAVAAYWRGYDHGEREEYDRQRRGREAMFEAMKEPMTNTCTCWRTVFPLNPIMHNPACPVHRTFNSTFTFTTRTNAKEDSDG